MLQIPAIHERCAGIDIGKRELAVTLIVGPADAEGEVKHRLVGTTVPALEELKQWLVSEGCTSVAMESTGSYWRPVKNVLEDKMEIVLVCAQKRQRKRGDKTDFRDADLLAQYQRHGLLKGSFLAPQAVVELRDLTRRRKKLLGNLAAEKNRIQKVLETANVKLGNIVSDVFGVSQQMLEALLSGRELPAEEIAGMAKRRLRQRIPELTEALQGHQMNNHHRWLINQSVEHIVLLDRQLEELETAIQERLKAWPEQNRLLQTIPGIKEFGAASILAEIGPDIGQFPSPEKLCKWAGVCPGNNRSAGKNKHGRIRKANKFLITALVEAAWAAARTQDSLFQRRFHRWMNHLGKRKADIALAHSLLRVVWAILTYKQPYREPDPQQMHEKERAKLLHHHSTRLLQLGADPALLAQLQQSIAQAPASTPSKAGDTAPARCPKASPPKVCRGALGFRTRQTRKQIYSVVKERPANSPEQQISHGGRRKQKNKPETN